MGWGGVETSHCYRVISVVVTNACPNPTHSGHPLLMTMLAMSLDKTESSPADDDVSDVPGQD